MVRRLPFHAVLFAAYPILFLYAHNLYGDVTPGDLVVPLVIALVGAAALVIVCRAVFGELHRAAVVASTLILVLFAFGHVARFFDPVGDGKDLNIVLAASVLIVAAVTYEVVHRPAVMRRLTGPLNVVAIALCVMNVVPVAAFELGTTHQRLGTSAVALPADVSPGRDVYYLIFDRYAGEQTLREDFGFDDSAFYSMLRSDGFYVAQQSLANYPKTTHSLASSLNMTYLDGLAERIGPDSGDWDPLTDSLDRSLVASTFQRIGYRYEHIGSWWPPTAADPSADENVVYGRAETFGQLVWETTAFPAVARTFGLDDDASFERDQYRRVAFQISALKRIARDPAATFTFAHFTLPHPPYVFDAEGRFLSPERVSNLTEDDAYLGQLRYANTQIAALLDTLLSGPSDEDPIIVLQSDEGPHPAALTADEDGYVWTQASDRDLGEKLRILNAYYLPGPARDALYQQISPVNSFRLILDRYFGADLPLLPDRTYVFERTAFPYRFTDVTARLRATATTPAGA